MIRFSTLYIHLYILLYTPYGSTLGRYPDLDGTLAPILSPFSFTEHTYITEYRSELFQWLPTNFEVDDDGHVKATSYINNIHPSHDGLYRCIEGVIKCFIPLWERVLTDMIHELPTRIQGSYLPFEELEYIRPREVGNNEGKMEEEEGESKKEEMSFYDRAAAYVESMSKSNDEFPGLPDVVPDGGFPGDLDDAKRGSLSSERSFRLS